MRRRFLFLSFALLAAIVVIVATVPLWLGVAAQALGPARGLRFARYERLGYGRFALHGAEFHRYGVRVTVERAEVETPVVWLWHRWRNGPEEIVVGAWRVDVERSTAPATPEPAAPGAERGWVPLRRLLQGIAAQLDRWIPRASVGPGRVQWPGGEISVAAAKWAGRELTARGIAYATLTADATLTFARDADSLRLVGRTTDGALAFALESRAANVSGDLTLWDQPARLSATFAPRGWLPGEALLQASGWNLPGERLKLGELYAHVRGDAQIEWRAERIGVVVSAKGEPLPGKPAPPLDIVLRGEGDGSAFTLQSLQVALPGVTAQLSAPVTIERSGKIRESAARFALVADLAKLPWLSARGAVNGEARVVSSASAAPVVEFSLDARDVSARGVALQTASARGRLDWPRLDIASGSLVGDGGERLTWRGGWDFQKKELIDAAIAGRIRRTALAHWLPAQPEFEVVDIDARAAGPLTGVTHSGRAEAAGVKVRGLNALAVTAQWRGRGATIESVEAAATAGASKVMLTGSVGPASAQLASLQFEQGGTERLRLTAPATIRWQPQVQLEALRLAGPEGTLTASGTSGEAGRIELAATHVASSWFGDFLAAPGPAWKLSLLALVGAWDRGPMAFTLAAGAELDMGEGRTAAVNLTARGGKDGVRLDALRATEANVTVINATGRLPFTFTPGASTWLNIDAAGALALDAQVASNPAFWQKLAAMSGVELQDPQASAHLTGTWQRPEGNASLKASRIAIDPKRVARPLPAIEALNLKLTGDRDGVTLDTFAVNVEGQAVKAQGRLPVPDGNWAELFRQPLATARRGADLRIEIPDAEIAVFARFLPAVLAPKGRLQADVHYRSGGLEGFLHLRDAASKPLGPLGVLQEINADVALAGRKFALRGVTAKSGGQPVTLSGTIELPEAGEPRFDLALRGENLPFMRQTGLLLRGDLDLKLQTPAGGPPRLSGNVRLRDSLFLSDVRAFLPKGGSASPSRRPPYFAVEMPPVNAWVLAVEVSGDRFMRLRTPVFAGVASAQFRLTGTLGEPRALGEISVDEGQVRMPFASFAVTQGSVRLTEADPFEPVIYLRATGRRYGYDLTMEIDGGAAQPNVVFTSSPALDSEQVLLMVMTGAAPSKDIANSATQRVANIGLFLGSSLLGSLGADAAEADKLSIASGEKISGQSRETYEIEYRLSDRWTLTGEYNEYDEYNAGVKWRVFRGKRAGAAEKANAKK